MNNQADFYLYILLCDKKILYTGIAISPEERLVQHQKGHPFGAKFTRKFKQLEIVYQVKVGNRSAAQSMESKVKNLNKKAKQTIIQSQFSLTKLISYLT